MSFSQVRKLKTTRPVQKFSQIDLKFLLPPPQKLEFRNSEIENVAFTISPFKEIDKKL